jgi:hypothetical protein
MLPERTPLARADTTASHRRSGSSSATRRAGPAACVPNTSAFWPRPTSTRSIVSASMHRCRTCPSSQRPSDARPAIRWCAPRRNAARFGERRRFPAWAMLFMQVLHSNSNPSSLAACRSPGTRLAAGMTRAANRRAAGSGSTSGCRRKSSATLRLLTRPRARKPLVL